MAEPTLPELERIWLRAERVKKLSDKIISFGPFGGIGLDSLISALNNPLAGPLAALGIGADEIYTWGAGLYLIYLAAKAHCSAGTIIKMFFYILVDSLVSAVPAIGSALDFLWQGHVYAARALQKDIERRYPWPPKTV
ncbi:MAG: DUF4112 domain-containing protein [Proteobacteria bacterium]|nr:DUF4112 domain-containing protein [Pseudomonadota bacterium]